MFPYFTSEVINIQETNKEFRNQLSGDAQTSQDNYDKTVITLSGGALVLSVTFVKEVAKNHLINTALLTTAWVSWSCSLFFMLLSFFTSHHAINYAIKQLDKGKTEYEDLASCASTLTKVLNVLGGLAFIVGIVAFLYFAHTNMEVSKMTEKPEVQATEETIIKGLPVRRPPLVKAVPNDETEQKVKNRYNQPVRP